MFAQQSLDVSRYTNARAKVKETTIISDTKRQTTDVGDEEETWKQHVRFQIIL